MATSSPSAAAGPGEPSKVIFLRGVPESLFVDPQCLQILNLIAPAGSPVRIYPMRTKRLIFMEFSTVDAARAVIDYFSSRPLTYEKYPIGLRFSDKHEITARNAISVTPHMSTQAGQYPPGSNVSPPRRIILVTLEGLTRPVTMDDLYHLFSLFGPVQRMSAVFKRQKNMVLVQFATPEGAGYALRDLNGQAIPGLCTLEIVLSTIESLTFARCDDRNHDYTTIFVPRPPVLGGVLGQLIYGFSPPCYTSAPNNQPPMGAGNARGGQMVAAMGGGVHQSMGAMGNNMNMDLRNAAPTAGSGVGSVLFVSGLDPDYNQTARDIFILFSLFGQVVMVKVLPKKKDQCLVQFRDSNQAQTARVNLMKVPYRGRQLTISLSRHETIASPVSDQDDGSLIATANSMPRRAFAAKNITPPSKELHVSNLPDGVSEEEVSAIFRPYGTVERFDFFNTTRQKGVVTFDSLISSVKALLALTGTQVELAGKPITVQVGFSKHTGGPRGGAGGAADGQQQSSPPPQSL